MIQINSIVKAKDVNMHYTKEKGRVYDIIDTNLYLQRPMPDDFVWQENYKNAKKICFVTFDEPQKAHNLSELTFKELAFPIEDLEEVVEN